MKLQRYYVAGIALTATFALTACGSDNTDSPAAGGASEAASSCAAGDLTAQGSSAVRMLQRRRPSPDGRRRRAVHGVQWLRINGHVRGWRVARRVARRVGVAGA